MSIISVNTVSSITFVIYKSHFCVCAFDYIPMLKCTIEVLNVIIIISNRRTSLDFDATKYDSLNMVSIDFHYLWVIPNLFRT